MWGMFARRGRRRRQFFCRDFLLSLDNGAGGHNLTLLTLYSRLPAACRLHAYISLLFLSVTLARRTVFQRETPLHFIQFSFTIMCARPIKYYLIFVFMRGAPRQNRSPNERERASERENAKNASKIVRRVYVHATTIITLAYYVWWSVFGQWNYGGAFRRCFAHF